MSNITVDRILDAAARNKTVRKWSARLDRLKKKGVSHRKFCLKHGIQPAALCRHLKQKIAPEWDSIRRVEKALAAEEKRFAR